VFLSVLETGKYSVSVCTEEVLCDRLLERLDLLEFGNLEVLWARLVDLLEFGNLENEETLEAAEDRERFRRITFRPDLVPGLLPDKLRPRLRLRLRLLLRAEEFLINLSSCLCEEELSKSNLEILYVIYIR
jgi:hypothetical protein